ncbi:hypothetical protein [Streptomyces sp. NBC_01803]|uniref:hypothetical protein n=1 Tax=Streptomyces sp. NBC_01803 TaxID=2975946 RepID=UPI002DDC0599|nr:hypothetical protein [Streptomyces sp. NBC_01803]WSA44239.1 hypothetical protein OIE51_08475 [Streptomyces sp. NBC_01803]
MSAPEQGADRTPGGHISYPEKETPELVELATRLDALLRPEDGDAGGLGHVVLFDGQLPMVSIAVDPDVAGIQTLPSGGHDAAAVHERTGRQLYHLLTGLEPELAALRSGPLIRTVLRAPTGALFFYLIDTGAYLYGSTTRPDRIDAVDRQLADAVNEIRGLVRLGRLNYGAFLTAGPSASRPPTPAYGTAVPTSAPRPPAGVPADGDPADHSGTVTLLRGSLGVGRLHYVAYYRDNQLAATDDMLDDDRLAPFFAMPTSGRERRRAQYLNIGQLLPSVVRRLDSTLRAVAGGHLLRLVLDVEQGAISYHALPGKRYLIGVTLDQERVADADRVLTGLGRDLAAD